MVTITDVAGCESSFSVTVSAVIGIAQNGESFVTRIYPNPNEGVVTVAFGEVAENSSFELSLRNIIGQEVMNKRLILVGQSEIQLSLTALDKGVYFLTVTGGDSEQTFKILVQ